MDMGGQFHDLAVFIHVETFSGIFFGQERGIYIYIYIFISEYSEIDHSHSDPTFDDSSF